jgi:hypothetical protein
LSILFSLAVVAVALPFKRTVVAVVVVLVDTAPTL